MSYTDGTSNRGGQHWMQSGLCRELDPELFYPIGISAEAQLQARKAIAWCQQCPVVYQCLHYALAENIEFGIWGATTEDQRRSEKRRVLRARAKERETAGRA